VSEAVEAAIKFADQRASEVYVRVRKRSWEISPEDVIREAAG